MHHAPVRLHCSKASLAEKMYTSCSELPSAAYANLGVDFHGEEEAEVGVGRQVVQLLLQLHQPLHSQVHVLQHHPAP